MGHGRIKRGLVVVLTLLAVGEAGAQTRRAVGGGPVRRGMVERNPDSLPLPKVTGAYSTRLLPGSRAPSLPELTLIRGDRVAEYPAGMITLVEFWATWCPNCRERAYKVGELQRAHPGKVREIAIVVPDRFGSSEAGARELARLANAGDNAGSIGWDAKGESRSTWLTPGRRTTVPSVFVVGGDGQIAWIGHPADASDVISKMLAGEWDIEDSAREYTQPFRNAEWRDEASQRFLQASRMGQWDAMLMALDDLDLYDPGIAGGTAATWIQRSLGDRRESAVKLALIAEKAVWDQDPHLLNDIAWFLLIAAEPSDDENASALRMARRASELSNREDGLIEDTLALAVYRSGDRDEAIRIQERSIRLVENGMPAGTGSLGELRDRLRMYQESEPVSTGQRKRPSEGGTSVPLSR
ncbi:MAG: hypothetical protein U0638_00350 [Phycisphaerales bacterium]